MNDILTDVLSEPFVLDYNGDMIMDFIVSTRTCKTYLWLGHNVTESEIVTAPYSNRKPSGICLKNLTDDEFVFAKPHSSAFLNLEHYQKNMNTDIFLAGEKEIKYIYNVEEQGFSMKENISYPKHKLRGQSAFMDFNYAGQMTHLIPVCLESKAGNFKDCRSIGLVAWHHDTRQWINVLDPEPANVSVNPNNRTLSFSEQSFFYNEITVPVALRVGDLNYDGYPDFATILVDVQSGRTFAAIYLNMADNNTEALSNPFKRKFQLCWLSEGRYAESIAMVSLFDLYDNGRLVLLLTKFNQEQGNTLQTVSYDYYIDHRLYYSFIRVTVITGRCTDKEGDQNVQCPKVRGKDQVALGSNPHGPNVCFAGPYTTQHSCSAQLTQSAHFALQLPYMIFGLGDILNVVSDLKVSIPNGAGKTRRRAWEEDIPGSKLVIVPYQLDQPENWYKRVYINMGIYSMFSLAFLCILCVFLIIAIYFLHCRERKEDRKDHMEYKKHWL
ncbi:PREDICTED: T-cell immunomodulatory protein-like [Rhagoletis zephyria]|uniref:T-cell immunomodulatory protein-like n=1 Tax=Rhagoletis zephyria TaxID=28612 RepID=UPI0008118AEC|nr:PREDICTED: T-cell immunomodulatory protein-like [Rhagoletis zephyria]